MRAPLLFSLLLAPTLTACGEPAPVDKQTLTTVGHELLAKVDHLVAGLVRLPDAAPVLSSVAIDGTPARFFFVGKLHLTGGWVEVDGSAGVRDGGELGPLPWIIVEAKLDGYAAPYEAPLTGALHVDVRRANKIVGTVSGRVRAGEEDPTDVHVDL